jgi:radical SAM protein with 4Fe4S-binding SPASM domain
MTEAINKVNAAFCFGHFDEVKNGFVFEESKYEKLKLLKTGNIIVCRDCFARFNCKGDCPANKAVVDPENFLTGTSYRCEAIRKFTLNLLKLVVEKHYDNVF